MSDVSNESVLTTEGFLPDWVVSLFTSLGLYFVVFGLGYFFIQYVKRDPPSAHDNSLWARFVRFFVFGYDLDEDVEVRSPSGKTKEPPQDLSPVKKALQLCFCAGGLLGSYLSWGILQEMIMTSEYGEEKERFKSSNFLVFCNRFLALTIAIVVVNVTEQPPMRAPFYKFSFTSLSNVLSSWCQLEALKYVPFPTQVLAKSSKLIPVMIMGKLVSGKKYPTYEYMVALVIGSGVSLFLATQESADDGKANSLSGILILVGYLTFDSFTSQWQGHLFREYKMSSYQMMVGVNAFSSSLTMFSLLSSGDILSGTQFCMRHPEAIFHVLGFSLSGAMGQMFIFYTIKTFGPLVFTLIMTVRQVLAIVLSVFKYGHHIDMVGELGIVIVFGAVAYKIWRSQVEAKKKKLEQEMAKQQAENNPDEENVPLTKA